MPDSGHPSSAPGPAVSDRVTLARAALSGALAVSGVRRGDAGPSGLHATAASGERLAGVRCSANPAGGYSVSLQLVCEAVPLTALSQRIRESVISHARIAGVLSELGDVDVRFTDLAIGV